ncbi:MAG: hypothetical protein WD342_05885 [Verrucomicrobiales bacterium]
MNPTQIISAFAGAAMLLVPSVRSLAQEDSGGASGSAPGEPGAAAADFSPSRIIEMRPSEKRPLELKSSERNPYAHRSAEKEATPDEGANDEEIQIRERLSSLSVTGRSHGANGFRVLLGDIVVETGRLLPQLLEDQTENLRVVDVDENAVVLAWVDPDTGDPTGKTMQITYDLSPSIAYALQGQEKPEEGSTTAPVRRMGVMRIGQNREKQLANEAKNDPAKRLQAEPLQAEPLQAEPLQAEPLQAEPAQREGFHADNDTP